MNIGPYTLHAIETGRFGLDGGAMFGIIPRPLWEKRIRPDERNRIPLHMRCLLLVSSDRVVLVDTGMGEKYDDRFADIYGVDREFPTLVESLKKVGYAPEDVTDVVLTHLHFDHCGGCTRNTDDGPVPVFPKAVHHVQRVHWDWAHRPNLRERASFLQENFAPVEAAGLLNLLDGDVEILPGIRARCVDGHTEAQQVIVVSDGDTSLAYVADLIPTAAHISAVWVMGYDLQPLKSIDEKSELLNEAVAGDWILFFEHDAEIETIRVQAGPRGPVQADAMRLAKR